MEKMNDLRSPKYIRCEQGDNTFIESWQYKTHLETHSKTKDKICNIYGKRILFGLETRAAYENSQESPCEKLSLLQQPESLSI